jgi:ribonucleotide monophosphatase NagD (HAD superfamily)
MLELHDSRSGWTYVWNGSHTVNVYDNGNNEVDCFTFGFDKETTFEDFCAAVARWIGE